MKNLCTALVIVLLIAAIGIGATVFITHKFDGVVAAFNDAGNKFEQVLAIFEREDVNGITRRVVNPDNIIKVSEYTFASGKQQGGITVTYDEDGVITLDGKCISAGSICLGEYYVLRDGYYTVAVLADEPARRTTSVRIVGQNDAEILKKPFCEPTTFQTTELQYVKIYISFAYGDEFNGYKIMPTLVSGTSMGQFFVDETIKF